ncbi:MAG: response regulator [Bacteroidales bacterium]|nr:response regulator [Bacteroidales bacterium]
MSNSRISRLLGSRHIVASEDSLVQAKRLEYLFKKNEINYKIFNNASDAYESIIVPKPALVISDVVMPGMDGFEFCTKIKNNKSLSNIPVMLLTALQDSDDIIKGLQSGADNFVTKPYDESEILERIEHLLENREIESISDDGGEINLKFRGNEYKITSSKRQIIDLLISVYETASKRNSELRDIKSQLERSNIELKQANSDLESFSRSVSHDLKSPLSVIMGFASAILDNPNSKISDEEREFMGYINESAEEMSQLIKDLLAFSQSGTTELKKEFVDISALAKEVVENLLLRYTDTNPKISIQDGLSAIADQNLIRIVLDNILGNAVKYSSKADMPTISFYSKESLGSVIYCIEDNGAGFNSEEAEDLFKPFIRYHGEDFSGTGVGLSTVKRIIERHGGSVWAESKKGQGAKFFFTIG